MARRLEPLVAHGVSAMSIGFLIEEEQPMVWRGPMVTQALDAASGRDGVGGARLPRRRLPPGTGDIQLTLSQRVPVSGAVIVTTPQEIALLDARKGLKMFQKVAVPVLGIVENMSTHVCSRCGHDRARSSARAAGSDWRRSPAWPCSARCRSTCRIREQTDGGRPTVVAEPDGPLGRAYRDIARRTAARLSQAGAGAAAFPHITVEES